MKNTQFLKQIKTCKSLRCGSRTALLFEGELPAGDTPMARHAHELAGALCDHAEREYFPAASEELAQLASVGRGYDFAPHRVQFCASARLVRGKLHLELSLRYKVGGEIRAVQSAKEIWDAGGVFRLK